jgi:hypothetical protein
MNFDFSDDQKQLRDEARKFLAEKCPPKAVRTVLDGKQPYDRELWKGLADMGFLGVAIPEGFGGAGAGHLELCALGSSFPFAPGTTTMLFWPSSPVLINATPDDSFAVPTPFTSTPALRSALFSAEPNESSPTFPTMLTGWPSLATPTAWLAPFPPWKVEKVRPVRVSPGSGTRSPAATKSKFMLPTTTMCLRMCTPLVRSRQG